MNRAIGWRFTDGTGTDWRILSTDHTRGLYLVGTDYDENSKHGLLNPLSYNEIDFVTEARIAG